MSRMRPIARWEILVGSIIAGLLLALAAAGNDAAECVDFRYSPPEWQAAICLPDDPHKTLVDEQGALLYHYEGPGFATRVAVETVPDAVQKRQGLYDPRVPIVETRREAAGLEILEQAFAVTNLRQPVIEPPLLRRIDTGKVLRNWVQPVNARESSLCDIAVGKETLQYQLTVPPGEARRIALAICEKSWGKKDRRIQVLGVEGAAARTVDTVADIGKHEAAVFWFDARDANRDGRIDITVTAAPAAADRYMILNGVWAFPADMSPDTPALLAGQLNGQAVARRDLSNPGGPARNDMILVAVKNTGAQARVLHPRLLVDTKLSCSTAFRRVEINGHEIITASRPLCEVTQEPPTRWTVQLADLNVPAGGTAAFCVHYSGGGRIVLPPAGIDAAIACRDAAIQYWRAAPLPHGRVQVPDPGVQALFDAAVRNIWQAREIKNVSENHQSRLPRPRTDETSDGSRTGIKNNLPVFQVGPTCYRGLWLVDGAFLLEAATLLGAGREARSGITYTLSRQSPSGAFEVLSPQFYKENGIVLWTCTRHARLTQDKAWLNSVWPQLERAAEYIVELRRQSLKNDTPLDDGLNPPGEIDGGLSGQRTGFKRPEFSNVHWNLLGLKAFIQAAHWLGKTDRAARWQREYDDLYAVFRKAAQRELCRDPAGNAYVPIFMANAGPELPQRGQWTFCHAVYPGQIFTPDDSLVKSTLAMLQATEREGMVYGTGWDETGIWNYFASFYGHAWLWQGHGQKAAQTLYAFANHAAPVLDWREEQSLRGEKFKKVGDMPHNWASAEFIRLTTHLLALDRGDELHLLEGLPSEWTRPGMTSRLAGIATPFGPLDMHLAIAADGPSARLHVAPLADQTCRKIVVHLGGWAAKDPHAVLELDPRQTHDRVIERH